MAKFTRNNAWNKGGTFDNPDLLWYAKGVGALMAKALNDNGSWWFFAAIHGQYVTTPGWASIPGPPAVPVKPVPTQTVIERYWDQCQHQSWYFLPWHRGYLIAIEAQIRAEVVKLKGPATWALPYWNYLGPDKQFQMPPAFAQQKLPDGSANPLFVNARYGPDRDRNIYIPTREVIKQKPKDPNFVRGPVTQDCLANTIFTGNDAATTPPGFGGPPTSFSHDGGSSGNLEGNPHNNVHVYVGNNSPDRKTAGLMSDPGTAALDPIFYLHHANIDRLWAVWNKKPTNTNPTECGAWSNGPAAVGESEFVMPMPGGVAWVYTPKQMNSLDQVDYTYDDLGAPPAPTPPVVSRLTRLGVAQPAAVAAGATLEPGGRVELVGASQRGIPLQSSGARTTVQLDNEVRQKVSKSLMAAAASVEPPDRVFLNLENVRGNRDSYVLSVYINLPDGANPADHPELLAGTVSLFGLRGASMQEGKHSGQGLNFTLEITEIVDRLHLQNALDADSLHVRIVPHEEVADNAQITIGRISVYRQGH